MIGGVNGEYNKTYEGHKQVGQCSMEVYHIMKSVSVRSPENNDIEEDSSEIGTFNEILRKLSTCQRVQITEHYSSSTYVCGCRTFHAFPLGIFPARL